MEKSREQVKEWDDYCCSCGVSENELNDAIEQQQQTITDLSTALDNVLHHTSTDTIAEAASVLKK